MSRTEFVFVKEQSGEVQFVLKSIFKFPTYGNLLLNVLTALHHSL